VTTEVSKLQDVTRIQRYSQAVSVITLTRSKLLNGVYCK